MPMFGEHLSEPSGATGFSLWWPMRIGCPKGICNGRIPALIPSFPRHRLAAAPTSDPALGARPMKRTVQKFIGDAIREALKSNEMPSGILGVSSTNDHLEIC